MYTLYKITIETDDDNIFIFNPDFNSLTKGAQRFAIKCSPLSIKKFLKRCGSADELCMPRSYRSITYETILSNILKGKDNSIYIFAHKYPKTIDQLKGLLQ